MTPLIPENPASPPPAVEQPKNQCMGCQADWPLVTLRTHKVIGGYPGEVVGCTKDKYPPAVEQETVRKKPLEERGDVAAKGAEVPEMALSVDSEPLPCPFCGELPWLGPVNPEMEGNCVGYVVCSYSQCQARPCVSHDILVNDERGTKAYQANAIERWNTRVVLSVEPALPKPDSVSGSSQTVVEPSDGNALNLLQKALNTLLRYAGWEHNYRPDGVELPMSRPADVQEIEELAEKCLSSHAPESDSGSGVSYPINAERVIKLAVTALHSEGHHTLANELESVSSSPSSPLLETNREEDSAPPAQPGDQS